MSTHHINRAGMALAMLLSISISISISDVSADSRRGEERRGEKSAPRGEQGYRLDQRHHHDRYYPSRGMLVDRLPHAPIVVPHRGTRYFFNGGVWYRPSGPRFVVTAPPIGLGISVLPPFFTTLWVGGVPYYYADGVYYNWRPSQREYVVVNPPEEPEVVTLPPEPEQLFVYPKHGQDEQQIANDRYECHRWAVDQTGFDPSQPGSGIEQSKLGEKRADYLRANKACLEARDYSVR